MRFARYGHVKQGATGLARSNTNGPVYRRTPTFLCWGKGRGRDDNNTEETVRSGDTLRPIHSDSGSQAGEVT